MSARTGAIVAAVLLLSVVVLVAVFAGGGGGGAAAQAGGAAAGERMDGVLTQVTEDGLVLQPYAAGAQPQRFAVRPEDRPVLDLPHLRQHVDDGTPVRLFYERAGGGLVARGYQDLLG